MKTFDTALWDNSDPLYAPCLKWAGRDGSFAYWVAPARYVKAGYAIKRKALGRGAGRDAPVDPIIAQTCRDLTREMVRWYGAASEPKVEPGTWHWLIARYKSDPYSSFLAVKPNTREGYRYWLDQIDSVLGTHKVAQTNFAVLSEIRVGKEAKGRSRHHIHTWFNTLRRIARHGVLIEAEGAPKVAEILTNMRLPAPTARNVAPTREQVAKIVAAADAQKMHAWAAGLLIQYWFGLRAVDVRGQYLDGRWCDGLTWGMFSDDLTSFEKVISKTRKSMPEPYLFDLTPLPDLRDRLLTIKASLPERVSGPLSPVTLNPRTLKPYTVSGWSHAWARLRKDVGLPDNLYMMDTRASAATEAGTLDLSPVQLRNAMGHKSVTTTDRYLRDRSTDLNKVVALRVNKR